MDVPVVFFFYNRPDKTRRSFAALRAAQPAVLYLVADGPRTPADAPLVAEARRVVETVDWPCAVRRLYADENLGCGPRIASGLDAVFRECDKAIVLEDDVVATPPFFDFCRDMLLRYEHDPRMMAVMGWNGLIEHYSDRCRAFVHRYVNVWGWATWRRAWAKFRYRPDWPGEWVAERLRTNFPDPFHQKLQRHIHAHRLWERYGTWDFQWGLSVYVNHGRVISPSVNLCRNIGFDAEGTHLTETDLRGFFQTLEDRFATCPDVVLDTDTEAGAEYDRRSVLLTLFSQYADVRRLYLLHKHPHLLPAGQSRVGWECSLQPFREAQACLDTVRHLARYVPARELEAYRSVFEKLVPEPA